MDKLKDASDIEGYDLIDIVAYHNYPQHKIDANGDFDGSGVKARSSTSTDEVFRQTRMDFPRSQWDETYIETSWITGGKLNGASNMILKRVQNSIDTYYPSVKIMIGEWDYDFDTDISHAVATADALGVFVNFDVEIANRWDLNTGNTDNFTSAAFQLFRNYDGNKSTIGDIGVSSTFDNRAYGSVWVTQDSDDNDLHIIVVSKTQNENAEFTIDLSTGGGDYVIEEVYGFDGTSKSLVQPTNNATVNNNSISVTMPPMSVYHLVVSQSGIICIKPNLGENKTLCTATSVDLSTGVTDPNATFMWTNDGNAFEAGTNYTATQAGLYRVTAKLDGCEDLTGEVLITSNLLDITTYTVCKAGDIAQLTINETGDYSWYAGANTSDVLSDQLTYSPVINESTTLYVQDDNAQLITLGKTAVDGDVFANTGATSYSNANREMYMNLSKELTLKSFNVFVNKAGTIVINFRNEAGSYSKAFTFNNVAVGEYVVNLDEKLSADNYFIDLIGSTAGVDLQTTNNSDNSVEGYISFGAAPAWATAYYGYFYSWNLEEGVACARTPLNVVLDPSAGKCMVTSSTSLEDKFTIYPNPTEGYVSFSSVVNYSVINMLGEVVLSGKGNTADLGDLPNGVYTVTTDKGQETIVKN